MTLPAPLLTQLLTLLAAIAGGFLFSLLHVPLAWMIGAMFGTAALSWTRPVQVPAVARPTALILIGLSFGQTFSGPVLEALLGELPVIVIAAFLSIGAGIATVPIFTRMAGLDAKAGFFSTIPGGVVVMAVLAQRAGAPIQTVTLAQTMRVLVVVLIMPPLLTAFAPRGGSGAFLAPHVAVEALGLAGMIAAGVLAALVLRRAGLANPWMIGPCLLAISASAFGLLPSGVPHWMVDAAQIGMGAALGQRMTLEFLLSSKRLMRASILSSVALSAACMAMAVGLAWIAGLPAGAVMVGMAPGGMPEMGVTAQTLGIAVPLVLGFHLARTLLCSFLLEPIFGLLVRLRLFTPGPAA
ncbi:AbrB family transcriptional regulator [Roseococcus sp. SYP-B2431]|uniref:AbrB family transcriptional regulator n=1 Tax=Roseococcus sp. SYP-B2431 TaxID=2496640 RepID=UPI0013F4B39F|nr:AbrB family transcriptional regulator [Roseococcus sp. SYP-B2431]